MTEGTTKVIVGEGILTVQGTKYRAVVYDAEFKLVHRPDGEKLMSFELNGEQLNEIGAADDAGIQIRVSLEPRTAEGVMAADGRDVNFSLPVWGVEDEDADFDEPGGTFYANAEHGWPKNVRLELNERNGTEAHGLFGITNEDGRVRLDVETALQVHAPITVASEIARALKTGRLELVDWTLGPKNLEGLPETDAIRHVDLTSNAGLTDAGLAPLQRLRGVESFKLAQVPLQGSGLDAIASWTSLRDLNLFNTELAACTGDAISALTGLRTLNLTFCKVPDAALAKLGKLRHLQHLYLSYTSTGDAGLTGFSGLAELETLSLSDTNVGDSGIANLGAMPHLVQISVANTAVGDRGLALLAANCPKLRILEVSGCKITAKGIAALAVLTKLNRIIADKTELGDDGLDAALALPVLDALIARNANTTAEGRARFRAARPHAFNFASDD